MLAEEIELLVEDAREHMNKTLQHLQFELGHIRAGRANPAMVEDVKAEVYGSHMPLNQLATISAPQADLIIVQPWDKTTLNAIEKAIMAANLGLNPSNDGNLIRLPVPPLSEERRIELVKGAKVRSEDARIAIRNIRRSVKDEIKKVQTEEKLSEDMRYEGEEVLQELTDKCMTLIDEMLSKKEEDIMSV